MGMRTTLALFAVLLVTSCEKEAQHSGNMTTDEDKKRWLAASEAALERRKAEAEANSQREMQEYKAQLKAYYEKRDQEIAEIAAEAMRQERRESRRDRRAIEQIPAPMSPVDPRRLAAAGSTEFAPQQRQQKKPDPKPVLIVPIGNGNYQGSDGTMIFRTGDAITVYPPSSK